MEDNSMSGIINEKTILKFDIHFSIFIFSEEYTHPHGDPVQIPGLLPTLTDDALMIQCRHDFRFIISILVSDIERWLQGKVNDVIFMPLPACFQT